MKKHPNILWICTDSQRWDTLGCFGNTFVHTPNLDRLAQSGVVFDHCYAQNPLCSPSRGGFLTGRYPITNKLRQNGQNIPDTEVLVPRMLADNGYVCGLSGKLHLSACDHRIKLYGRDDWWKADYDTFFTGIERRINDGYTEFYWDHAPSGKNPASSYTRWVKEKGATISYPPRDDSHQVVHGMPVDLHQTTFCAEKAIDFIEAHNNRHYPWMFSVNIFDPHFTLDPPDDLLDRYLDKLDDIPLPARREGELDEKPWYHKRDMEKKKRFDPATMSDRDHRLCRAAYWAQCDLIDLQVGRILDTLEKSGQTKNTMVIFTSDHGELLGDHSMYIKGPFLYDCSIRVPLIISMPGTIQGGRRADGLVELNDLAPTVLDCCGIAPHDGMQARSLWSSLKKKGGITGLRDSVYCEYLNANPHKRDEQQFCTMVRTREFKLIRRHGEELGELYDMQKDPAELTNLWNSDAHASVKMDLLGLLSDRMAMTADPLPHRVGIY